MQRRDVADRFVAHERQHEFVIAGAAADDRLLEAGAAHLLDELCRHRAHHQREYRVGVRLDRRDEWPEVLGAERGPDLLDDLAAAILKRLLEAADDLVAEGVVRRDRDDLFVALIARPLAERMMGLRARPAGADQIREVLELALREIVRRRDRRNVHCLEFGTDRRKGVAGRGQHAADEHMHLVLQDEFLGLGDGDVALALLVLDDELDVHAAKLVAVLLEVEQEAIAHVDAGLREAAGERREIADAELFRAGGSGQAEADRDRRAHQYRSKLS